MSHTDKKETERENVAKACGLRLPYGFIGRSLLGMIAIAGVLSIALAAPGIFQAVRAFEKLGRGNYRRYQSPAFVRAVVKKLEKRGLVLVFQRGDETVIRLTERGRRELLKYRLQEKSLKKWRWDKKWRILTFDIAEKKRVIRDTIRKHMQSFGFVRLQDSVWVYPYECEEVVSLLKTEYRLGKELLSIVAGEIENDEWLKKRFDLA